MNKRGPKPSGVETAVLYKRLPKEDKEALSELVDAALTRTLDKWSEKNKKFMASKFMERYGVAVDLEPKPEPKPLVVHVGADEMLSKYKEDIRRLLEDNDRLELEKKALEKDVEAACMMDLDEKGKLGWRKFYDLQRSKATSQWDQTT